MQPSPFILFLLGMAASFSGTMPFGPLNLRVVDTVLNRSLRAALYFAIAASMIEVLQSFIAIRFNAFLEFHLQKSPWVRTVISILLVIIGLFFVMIKSDRPKSNTAEKLRNNGFLYGMTTALWNPQAIPFWIFVVAYYRTSHWCNLNHQAPWVFLIVFLSGVAFGKFLGLLTYVRMSKLVVDHAAVASRWMNKMIGGILITVGVVQGIRHAFGC
jgi:threonine/homoserine/homoserine lactone efflux protein